MPWTSSVDAELAVFLAGEATGHGIADVLFGKVNPGAKSPATGMEMTWKMNEHDAKWYGN